jgi:hypothetical protein
MYIKNTEKNFLNTTISLKITFIIEYIQLFKKKENFIYLLTNLISLSSYKDYMCICV